MIFLDTIFVVEDDENIRDLILYALRNSNFQAIGLESSKDLYEKLEIEIPILIILDIMLPGDDGFTVLDKLKSSSSTSHIPVIFLTAKTSEINRVRGLDLGADDYVLKPFSVIELISRVKAVLRRYNINKLDNLIKLDNLELNSSSRTLKIDGNYIDLTYKEFQLLEYLLHNKNIVLTRETIMNKVWGYDFQGETRTIDVHIGSLRQKLGPASKIIQTVRNVGYKVEV